MCFSHLHRAAQASTLDQSYRSAFLSLSTRFFLACCPRQIQMAPQKCEDVVAVVVVVVVGGGGGGGGGAVPVVVLVIIVVVAVTQ